MDKWTATTRGLKCLEDRGELGVSGFLYPFYTAHLELAIVVYWYVDAQMAIAIIQIG